MKNLEVLKYTSEKKADWDNFIKNSKNGTFLFYRDFMEYHHDRFEDFSLMVYEAEKVVALFPANRVGNKVCSHQGLTYGGVIFSKKIKYSTSHDAFQSILEFLEKEKVITIYLKSVPKIYHKYPSDELDYLLFLVEAKLYRRDLSVTIFNTEKLKIQSNRLEGVKKAKKQNLSIQKETSFENFWNEILIPNLDKTHNAKPVHSLNEIEKLAKKIPNNIHQFNVYTEGKIVGGATIFETEKVAHVQYISANEKRQTLGTLDFLFQYLIEIEYAHKTYFDFGTSNEKNGLQLNKGLLYWKECFGGRSIVHDFYEINTKNYQLLNDVFI